MAKPLALGARHHGGSSPLYPTIADLAQRQSTKLLISGSRYRNSESAQQWPSGVMGATLVLGTSVERRESSNLSLVTGEWLVLNNSVYRKYKIGVSHSGNCGAL